MGFLGPEKGREKEKGKEYKVKKKKKGKKEEKGENKNAKRRGENLLFYLFSF